MTHNILHVLASPNIEVERWVVDNAKLRHKALRFLAADVHQVKADTVHPLFTLSHTVKCTGHAAPGVRFGYLHGTCGGHGDASTGLEAGRT